MSEPPSGQDAKHDAKRFADIIRGRMTPAEKAEIERLAAKMKNPKPGPIANRMKRHPATVAWYMYRNGLLIRPNRTISRSYTTSAGIVRHGWSADQDSRLTELLASGQNYRQAGEALTAEFGILRNGHQCQVRAVLLAAVEDGVN